MKKYIPGEGSENYNARISGRIPFRDIYITRYYARKAATGHQKTIKVDGGYRNMEPDEYRIWRDQK